jgi:uncharacterized caspase-like protein
MGRLIYKLHLAAILCFCGLVQATPREIQDHKTRQELALLYVEPVSQPDDDKKPVGSRSDVNGPDNPAVSLPAKSEVRFEEFRPTDETQISRIALVIGNSEYKNTVQLKNPAHDAEAVTKALVAANFTVIKAIDLDRSAMSEVIRNFAGRIRSYQVGLFYYAGHAVEVGGENFLLPVDIKAESRDAITVDGFSMSTIVELLDSVETRILILDACRDDPFRTAGSTRAIAARGLAQIKLDRGGTFVAYSTSPGGVAADGDGDNSPFSQAFADAISLKGLEIEQVARQIRKAVYRQTRGRQRPWTHSSLLDAFYFFPPTPGAASIPAEGPVPFALEASLVTVLGPGIVSVGDHGGSATIEDGEVLQSNGFFESLRNGVNILRTANGGSVRAWLANRYLELLSDPYEKSYAVVVAIDEYDASSGRGGYRNLGFMVDGAKKIVNELARLGFQRQNIIELYNDRATHQEIESALAEFWPGGKYEAADRVVFYFGGHGDKIPRMKYEDDAGAQKGFLVTYDLDRKKILQTGILLDDIIGRQFRNTSARQFLVLLDACSSGLVLPRFQDERDERELRRLQRLSSIKFETSKRSRAILVAGTGDEQALWVNGGIFTRAVIKALKGAGDWNKDGLIIFDELAEQVRTEVQHAASQMAIAQEPAKFATGPGRFMFILPEER